MAGEMATAADGTHPTGMHSCYLLFLLLYTEAKNLVFVLL